MLNYFLENPGPSQFSSSNPFSILWTLKVSVTTTWPFFYHSCHELIVETICISDLCFTCQVNIEFKDSQRYLYST